MSNDELLVNPGVWPIFKGNADLSGHVHNPFFVQTKDGKYFDIADRLGLDGNNITRGIATADINGDGKLDFCIANQWEPSVLYINNSNSQNAFMNLQLFLPLENNLNTITIDPNYSIKGVQAIGTYIEVTLPDGNKIVDYVKGGNGHSGKSSNEIHLGLGKLNSDIQIPVKINWRDRNGVIKKNIVNLKPGSHKIYLY